MGGWVPRDTRCNMRERDLASTHTHKHGIIELSVLRAAAAAAQTTIPGVCGVDDDKTEPRHKTHTHNQHRPTDNDTNNT